MQSGLKIKSNIGREKFSQILIILLFVSIILNIFFVVTSLGYKEQNNTSFTSELENIEKAQIEKSLISTNSHNKEIIRKKRSSVNNNENNENEYEYETDMKNDIFSETQVEVINFIPLAHENAINEKNEVETNTYSIHDDSDSKLHEDQEISTKNSIIEQFTIKNLIVIKNKPNSNEIDTYDDENNQVEQTDTENYKNLQLGPIFETLDSSSTMIDIDDSAGKNSIYEQNYGIENKNTPNFSTQQLENRDSKNIDNKEENPRLKSFEGEKNQEELAKNSTTTEKIINFEEKSLNNSEISQKVKENVTELSTNEPHLHGGVCECYCPCLDEFYSSGSGSGSEDYEITHLNEKNKTNESYKIFSSLVQGSGSGESENEILESTSENILNLEFMEVLENYKEEDKNSSDFELIDEKIDEEEFTTTEKLVEKEVESLKSLKNYPADPLNLFELQNEVSYTIQIEPYSFYHTKTNENLDGLSFHTLLLAQNKETNLVMYGRKKSPPKLSENDLVFKIKLNASDSNIENNSSIDTNTEFVEFCQNFRDKLWYISLFNDNSFEVYVQIKIKSPSSCSNGKTLTRDQKSEKYCDDLLCGEHGACDFSSEKCICNEGYTGEFCNEVECGDCFNNGVCVNGTCFCGPGHKGPDCSEEYVASDHSCIPDCSNHGTFNYFTQKCICEPKWSGVDCSLELCETDCGPNGICMNDACACQKGWTGHFCMERECDKRCMSHGQCKNGTCACLMGYNGKFCTLEGCPKSCSGNGFCKKNNLNNWHCECGGSYQGKDCSVAKEQVCNDTDDNDNDGLTDCVDPDCCSSAHCSNSDLCHISHRPLSILTRKQAPPLTAPFFDRIKFLIEPNSTQSYAKIQNFIPVQASVLRGRVVTSDGIPLLGVRVAGDSPVIGVGFTLSQEDGFWELVVNGGGVVGLKFSRISFRSVEKSVEVPWNKIITLDDIIMDTKERRKISYRKACESHNYENMNFYIYPVWNFLRDDDIGAENEFDENLNLASQSVTDKIGIPGSNIKLMYTSRRFDAYKSILKLRVTPKLIPPSLLYIHLKISIEGVTTSTIFEPEPLLNYTFSWDRKNAYRQIVFGVSEAVVNVGWEYEGCEEIIWSTQKVEVFGNDMPISDMGGWNVDIQHRFSVSDGILYKGDGSTNYFSYTKPHLVQTVAGDGYQRGLNCESKCIGNSTEQRLLSPVALTTTSDGSIIIGDFNFIRILRADGKLYNVLKLNTSRISYRYHLATNPLDNSIYLSDPESHQILKISTYELDLIDNLELNWSPFIGSGARCLPGDEAHCGDESFGKDAKLAYPKGVAVSKENEIFIADGTNVRKVDNRGIITTIIGNHMHKSHFKPIACEGVLKIEEVYLRWPTELVINPLDDSLYILDNDMILRLTSDSRVQVMAGRPLHCPLFLNGDKRDDLGSAALLTSPQSMSFGKRGELYVAESDGGKINRIRVIESTGKIKHFAGEEVSKCSCLDRECSCFDPTHFSTSFVKFSSISAIAYSPNGKLYVVDQGNYRIRAIYKYETSPDVNGLYSVYEPQKQEVYVFNKFGLHLETRNILTGRNLHSFNYNSQNTANGKLVSIIDGAGNKISFIRDYTNTLKSIENAKGHKFLIKMNKKSLIEKFITPDATTVSFDYYTEPRNGLLKSRYEETGKGAVFNYDEFSRVVSKTSSSGNYKEISFELTQLGDGKITMKNNNGGLSKSLVVYDHSTQTFTGSQLDHSTNFLPYASSSNTSFINGKIIKFESAPYFLLHEFSPLISELFRIPSKFRTEIGGINNRAEWKYVVRREGKGKKIIHVEKKLKMNGENVLTIQFDRENSDVIVYREEKDEMIRISYDEAQRAVKWGPNYGFSALEVEYNANGELSAVSWGNLRKYIYYDEQGRLSKYSEYDETGFSYNYPSSQTNLPSNISTVENNVYSFSYDKNGLLESITKPQGSSIIFNAYSTILGNFFELTYGLSQIKISKNENDVNFKASESSENSQIFLNNESEQKLESSKINYNDNGNILGIFYPQNFACVDFIYNDFDKIELVLAGLFSAKYVYFEKSGSLKSAEIIQGASKYKYELKYHRGLIKELKFKPISGENLEIVEIYEKFHYDTHGRISSIDFEINGESAQGLHMKINPFLGNVESVDDISFSSPLLNRTVLFDASKSFFRTREKDDLGRMTKSTLVIKNQESFKMSLAYDKRGKLIRSEVEVLNNHHNKRYEYSKGGYLYKTESESESSMYEYDKNGNIVKVTHDNEIYELSYDVQDRVIQKSNLQTNESCFYSYDLRGFLIHENCSSIATKYSYDDLGHLISIKYPSNESSHLFYDHLDRLIFLKTPVLKIQLIYGHPFQQNLVTNGRIGGKNWQYLYDENLVIFCVIDPNGERFYVESDESQSVLAIFNIYGDLVQMYKTGPFGEKYMKANETFIFPFGHYGGILEPLSGINIINGRAYDGEIKQFLTPKWTNMANGIKELLDIYIYRFMNNDPVNKKIAEKSELTDWLKFFAFDMNKISASKFMSTSPLDPTSHILFTEKPQDKLISQFENNLFYPNSLLKCPLENNWFMTEFSPKVPIFNSGLILTKYLNGSTLAISTGRKTSASNLNLVVANILSRTTFSEYSHFDNKPIFKFIKTNPLELRDDYESLKNIEDLTTHVHGSGNETRELEFEVGGSIFFISYGPQMENLTMNNFKQLRKKSIEKAWSIEKEFIKFGIIGRYNWTESEKEEILKTGYAQNYKGTDLYSAQKSTRLLNNPFNILFQKETSLRNRRKSGSLKNMRMNKNKINL